jgi:cytochrome oxidase Cu insertion factor (SCO1/SenC/PrrC family)
VRLAAAAALLLIAVAVPAVGHEVAPLPALDFEPPAPGTYTLHRIMAAPDGEVLGLDARPQPFRHFTRDRITLLGLIYTTCVDPEGCPLAARVFDAIRHDVAETPSLRGKVRLVSLSFDPERDTPAAMRGYAGSRATDDGSLPWYFLTTRGARALRPLVDGLGQDVRHTMNRSNGRPQRELSHVLKVFLIDRAGFVREIYSSTFLHPRTVLNDIETLLMEP